MNDNLVHISLIIVVRNAIEVIERSIDSLLNQTYPQDLCEYIFVDGLSFDGTKEYLENKVLELQQKGLRAKLLINENKILSSGWNLAIQNSSYDLVCRIDAHSIIDKDYIKVGVTHLLKTFEEVVAIGGVVIKYFFNNWQGEVVANVYSSGFSKGWSPFRKKHNKELYNSDTAVFAIYKKSKLIEAGLFDPNLQRVQDIKLHNILLNKGYKFITCSQMHVFIFVPNSILKALLIKAFKTGFWIPYAYLGFSFKVFRFRHWVPFAFSLYILILPFLVALGMKSVCIPLVLYIILSLIYGIKDADKGFIKILFPIFLFIYHFTYGLGTLLGIISLLYHYRRCNYERSY